MKIENSNIQVEADENSDNNYLPAIRLVNNADGSCAFQTGKIETLKHMNTTTFWINNKTEEWEKDSHPAPRRQYVITLKGEIKFKVSDNSTFIIKPGIILLAEDLKGEGHSWDMIKGDVWERLYVPIAENADDNFVPDTSH